MSPSKNVESFLQICDLRLQLSIGCSEEERQALQAIRVDIACFFHTLPPGFYSDAQADTLCYDGLVQALLRYIRSVPSHALIEHLAYRVHLALSHYILQTYPHQASWIESLKIAVTKLQPPLVHVQGGATIHYQAPLAPLSP